MPTRTGAVAIIPAKDEAQRIAQTVVALAGLDVVLSVIVIDDGSTDNTADVAGAAGAYVMRHPQSTGKAGAMTTGVEYADQLGYDQSPVLFADADLAATASALADLVHPVLADEADLTIATLPPQQSAGGGSGRVVRLGREGIEAATGWTAKQPLSGQRCLNRAALEAATPFAPGWGVEVGMSIDVLQAGLRVVEVPVDLQHRVTGTDLRAKLHRAAQYRDVRQALRRRADR